MFVVFVCVCVQISIVFVVFVFAKFVFKGFIDHLLLQEDASNTTYSKT